MYNYLYIIFIIFYNYIILYYINYIYFDYNIYKKSVNIYKYIL